MTSGALEWRMVNFLTKNVKFTNKFFSMYKTRI